MDVLDERFCADYNSFKNSGRGTDMKRKILWITRTAALLALLVVLQWLTKPLGQLATGSCVNAVLAVAGLFGGWSCALTVALISPVCAWLLNITQQILTVPVIMLGNAVFVTAICLLAGANKGLLHNAVGCLAGAVCKFAVLCLTVNWVLADILPPALTKLSWLDPAAAFGIMQLFTALLGSAVALSILPVLKRAIKGN